MSKKMSQREANIMSIITSSAGAAFFGWVGIGVEEPLLLFASFFFVGTGFMILIYTINDYLKMEVRE